MAFTYKTYTDSAVTAAAKKKKEETERNKPGEYTESDKVKYAENALNQHNANKPGEFNYDSYSASDTVKAAEKMLNDHMANKPGEYNSKWQSGLDETMNKILNREKFSYDLNGDMLYQQYKDQFVNQGKMAMMDTIGQASAMTGGYGNSYAQSVGQQTYQGYLQQLNDKIPELYQLALDKYNMEGEELYNQYGLYADREDRDYGRYRDKVSDWNTDRDYYRGVYDTETDRDYGRYIDGRDFAYGQHRDNVGDWYTDRDYLAGRYDTERGYDYQQYRDNVGDWQFQYNADNQEYWDNKKFDYGQFTDDRNLSYTDYRNNISDEQWQKTFDEGVRQFNESQKNKSSGGTKNTDKPKDDEGNKKVSLSTIQKKCAEFENNDDLLEYLGARVDEGSIDEDQMDELYSKYAITKNLNTSGSKYAYGTGATGGYNTYTQNKYSWK